ncbi:unnamed protein product [Anisakis simplex]|uniref:Transcription-repair coupling factor n=1 Tax=Anisakis simplex TaxID=6269 RepID=A0A0M3JZN6_ANISI|nr:unnamed protein product [Anisakis simplex]
MIISNREQHRRECAFLVFCDARITPAAITREIEKSHNVDIHHVEAQESAWGLSKKLYRFHVDYDPGVVVLISGASNSYRPVLTKLTRCGWRVQLIHPKNTCKEITEYVDESCSVESFLGSDIEHTNVVIDFPNSAYFVLSELNKSDLAIEMFNNVAEQYESKVIYFNERTAEAVIELRAFDVERFELFDILASEQANYRQ